MITATKASVETRAGVRFDRCGGTLAVLTVESHGDPEHLGLWIKRFLEDCGWTGIVADDEGKAETDGSPDICDVARALRKHLNVELGIDASLAYTRENPADADFLYCVASYTKGQQRVMPKARTFNGQVLDRRTHQLVEVPGM